MPVMRMCIRPVRCLDVSCFMFILWVELVESVMIVWSEKTVWFTMGYGLWAMGYGLWAMGRQSQGRCSVNSKTVNGEQSESDTANQSDQ
ncbi:hypothetical protein DSCA_23160 [Desulfosarcina alkanivorans]|uniref:Uncharacterized protein n=1 Tax=Desulfosarcina alkanivorans TaxID=571177 RepID=A0A5K7YGZ0_9BACT|nr:hypothetical protein DSCA_23160 [Desulfosarcina alkanivorans]